MTIGVVFMFKGVGIPSPNNLSIASDVEGKKNKNEIRHSQVAARQVGWYSRSCNWAIDT